MSSKASKRIILITALIVVVGIGAFIVFRSMSVGRVSAGAPKEISPRLAEILQAKIDAVKKKEAAADPNAAAEQVELSEPELESYVLYSLREKIPAQLDSMDVQLGEGTVASDTQITFTSNSTGNPIVDTLVGGTHNLFVKGNLTGEGGRGKFDLQEVRVDGIPVPNILIQTLFDKYVQPKYPEADLKEPFDLPWGIEQITIVPGKATVVY